MSPWELHWLICLVLDLSESNLWGDPTVNCVGLDLGQLIVEYYSQISTHKFTSSYYQMITCYFATHAICQMIILLIYFSNTPCFSCITHENGSLKLNRWLNPGLSLCFNHLEMKCKKCLFRFKLTEIRHMLQHHCWL